MSRITSVIPTYNNLPYLKLTVQSVRQNCYYKDMPIFIFAENCTDGTNEWLGNRSDELGIEYYIEDGKDREDQLGIGGGIDLCVSKVKTEFVNILHSDFWVAPNQDIELLKLFDEFPNDRLITSSFRVQPNIFPNENITQSLEWMRDYLDNYLKDIDSTITFQGVDSRPEYESTSPGHLEIRNLNHAIIVKQEEGRELEFAKEGEIDLALWGQLYGDETGGE